MTEAELRKHAEMLTGYNTEEMIDFLLLLDTEIKKLQARVDQLEAQVECDSKYFILNGSKTTH